VRTEKKTHRVRVSKSAPTALTTFASSRTASRACALSAAPASARLNVLTQNRARTHEYGEKGRLGVQRLRGARARCRTAGGAGRGARCEPDSGIAGCLGLGECVYWTVLVLTLRTRMKQTERRRTRGRGGHALPGFGASLSLRCRDLSAANEARARDARVEGQRQVKDKSKTSQRQVKDTPESDSRHSGRRLARPAL
jgi:hypothetical protein